MSLSPVDNRAVVKLGDGRMRVLKPGDVIDGTGATLIQVLADKLVLELTSEGSDPKEKTTVWLHKAKNGASQVQRLERQAPTGAVEMQTAGGKSPKRK